jgi:sucrose phosphorylase
VLADPASHQHRVFAGYRAMLRIRRQYPAFHPAGEQRILDIHPAVFAVARTAPGGEEQVMCLINVSERKQMVELAPALVGLPIGGSWLDLFGGERYAGGEVELEGYEVMWLVAE